MLSWANWSVLLSLNLSLLLLCVLFRLLTLLLLLVLLPHLLMRTTVVAGDLLHQHGCHTRLRPQMQALLPDTSQPSDAGPSGQTFLKHRDVRCRHCCQTHISGLCPSCLWATVHIASQEAPRVTRTLKTTSRRWNSLCNLAPLEMQMTLHQNNRSFLSMYLSHTNTENLARAYKTGGPRSKHQSQKFVASVLDGT